jgi:mono/diheme cytochrome c family protein
MQKILKLSLLVVFLATGFFVFTSRASAVLLASEKIENAPARKVYMNNCARCHGADGRGQTELGIINDTPDLTAAHIKRMSSQRITRVIAGGTDSMPGFGKKLSKAEIASLVGYIRTLK